MAEFLLGVYIGLGFTGFAAFFAGAIGLIIFLAKNNIILTMVAEGSAKQITKFDRMHKIIISYTGHTTSENYGIGNVVELQNEHPDKDKKRILGGLYIVGIPGVHKVYKYKFKWLSFEETADAQGFIVNKVVPHEEVIDYIMLKDDVYYTSLREAETKGVVQVNVDLLLTIRIINPHKALNRVQDWLEATLNQVKPVLRDYIKTLTPEEIMASLEETENGGLPKTEEIDQFIRNYPTNNPLRQKLIDDYGVKIKKCGIVHVDPAGPRASEYIEAASKKWEAEKEADRLNKIIQTIKDQGDQGMYLRTLEALEKVGQGQSNLVFPIGSVPDLIRAWMGKQSSQGG